MALAAVVAACAADPQRARRFARTPVLPVLVVLGALGAVSAAWTVGIDADAVRWGAVTAAFAAVALASAVLVRDERDAALAAAGVAALAVGVGIVGLVGATETIVPLAHREAGKWRPAAMFEYAPALALLIVSALPPLIAGMCRGNRWLRPAAAFGGAVAGAVLALAESRTQLAFAVLVCAVAVTWPQRTVRAPRGTVAAAVALIAAGALGAYAVAGGYIPLTPPPDGTARLLAVLAVLVAATAAWAAAQAAMRRGLPAPAIAALFLAAGVAGAVAKPAPRLISSGVAVAKHHKAEPRPHRSRLQLIRDELLHGRLKIWQGAIDSFSDRPLQGGGADSYLFASAGHQGSRSVFYAHDLPLELAAELGIAGLLLALALYATAGRALWRSRAGPAFWLLGPAAIAFLAANLVDWPWHLAGSGAVWAAALGAVLGSAGATRDGH